MKKINEEELNQVDMRKKQMDFQKAQRTPNAQVSVPGTNGKKKIQDLKGVIMDPDKPGDIEIAVAGPKEGELAVFDIEDSELLEDISRLSELAGIKK